MHLIICMIITILFSDYLYVSPLGSRRCDASCTKRSFVTTCFACIVFRNTPAVPHIVRHGQFANPRFARVCFANPRFARVCFANQSGALYAPHQRGLDSINFKHWFNTNLRLKPVRKFYFLYVWIFIVIC